MRSYFIKRAVSITLAVVIAVIVSYFFAKAENFWMPIATILVMQTTIAAALRQGLLRFFLFALVVAIGTAITIIIHPEIHFSILYGRLYDIAVGAVIGIIINLLVLPPHADVEFRNDLIPILNAYENYLVAILNLLLQKENALIAAENKKQWVEKMLLQFSPTWIYARGFSFDMRQGYRYFLIMTERVEQILFSLHHISRYQFDKVFLQDMQGSLISYVENANKIMGALVTVLSLKKIAEGLNDLSDEIQNLEKEFQTATPVSLELLDMSKDYIYFAALIADLKDLRTTLLGLTQTLRD